MSDVIVAIIVAVFASSGFWAFLTAYLSGRQSKQTADHQLLLGLAHDRLYMICQGYISRGYITLDEYDNLLYIYKPYVLAGGNGTGKKLFEAVERLPMRDENGKQEEKIDV